MANYEDAIIIEDWLTKGVISGLFVTTNREVIFVNVGEKQIVELDQGTGDAVLMCLEIAGKITDDFMQNSKGR